MNQKDNFKLSQQGNAESVLPNSLPQHIEAKIQGEISGQVAVGSHILQIGSVHGGVVNINSVEELRPQIRSLPAAIPNSECLSCTDRSVEICVRLASPF